MTGFSGWTLCRPWSCAISTPAATSWSCRRSPTPHISRALGPGRQRGDEPGAAGDRERRRRSGRRRTGARWHNGLGGARGRSAMRSRARSAGWPASPRLRARLGEAGSTGRARLHLRRLGRGLLAGARQPRPRPGRLGSWPCRSSAGGGAVDGTGSAGGSELRRLRPSVRRPHHPPGAVGSVTRSIMRIVPPAGARPTARMLLPFATPGPTSAKRSSFAALTASR